MVTAYVLMVGAPVLGLFGILEAGRSVAAPPSIGGEWTLQFDALPQCAAVPASLNISQSGPDAVITLNDGRTIQAVVTGATLSGKSLRAAITGKLGARTLAGVLDLNGCGSVAFHAVRRTAARRDA
jgi:hypothetical protein